MHQFLMLKKRQSTSKNVIIDTSKRRITNPPLQLPMALTAVSEQSRSQQSKPDLYSIRVIRNKYEFSHPDKSRLALPYTCSCLTRGSTLTGSHNIVEMIAASAIQVSVLNKHAEN